MRTVKNLQEWLAANQDADPELTAHRLQKLIQQERQDVKIYKYTGRVLLGLLIAGVVALLLTALVSFINNDNKIRSLKRQHSRAISEQADSMKRMRAKMEAKLIEAQDKLDQAKDRRALVTEHTRLVIEGCKK